MVTLTFGMLLARVRRTRETLRHHLPITDCQYTSTNLNVLLATTPEGAQKVHRYNSATTSTAKKYTPKMLANLRVSGLLPEKSLFLFYCRSLVWSV